MTSSQHKFFFISQNDTNLESETLIPQIITHSLSWIQQSDCLIIYCEEKVPYFHTETIMMIDCSLNLGPSTIKNEKLPLL